jgi:hypothetical protein
MNCSVSLRLVRQVLSCVSALKSPEIGHDKSKKQTFQLSYIKVNTSQMMVYFANKNFHEARCIWRTLYYYMVNVSCSWYSDSDSGLLCVQDQYRDQGGVNLDT